MAKLFAKDILEKKEFKFGGDTLRLKECVSKEKHIYVFARYNEEDRLIAYEVVKGIKAVNPDGSIVYHYPSSEQFGHYGYTIFPTHKKGMKEAIEKLLELN